MLTKKIYTLFFFNNIFCIYYTPPHPPPPQIIPTFYSGRSSAKFFAGEHFLEYFSRAHPHKYSCPSFIFILPPHHPTGCATGRENFLYRTFCGKIFVSSPTKNYTLTPVSISNIKSLIISQEKKSKLYPHGTLYPLYLTAKHRTGFNPLLCRYILSLL